MGAKKTDYLITDFSRPIPERFVWHPSEPFTLGFPARWTLTQTDSGLFVSELHQENYRAMIPESTIQAGQVLTVKGANGTADDKVSFSIQRLVPLQPAFTPPPADIDAELETYLFCGIGEQLFSHGRVDSAYKARIGDVITFQYTHFVDRHCITPMVEELFFQPNGKAPISLAFGKEYSFSPNDFSHGSVVWKGHWWRFVPVPVNQEFQLTRIERKHPKEDLWLRRFSTIAVSLFLGLALLVHLLGLDQPKKKIVQSTEISLKSPKWIPPAKVVEPPKPKLEPKPKPEPPKPKPKAKEAPKPKPAPPVASKRPEPRKVAQKPIPRPVEPPPAPKADLAKSLSFLSTPSGKRPAGTLIDASKARELAESKYARQTSLDTKTSKLSEMERPVDSKIDTRNARDMDREDGNRDLRGSGRVQGKVSLSALRSGASAGIGSDAGTLTVSGKGSISEAMIAKALEKSLNRFQYCYEKALLADPSLTGVVVAQWTIGEDGVARDPRIVRSQINQSGLHRCLQAELEKVRFPSPSGGPVTVQYPFSFANSPL